MAMFGVALSGRCSRLRATRWDISRGTHWVNRPLEEGLMRNITQCPRKSRGGLMAFSTVVLGNSRAASQPSRSCRIFATSAQSRRQESSTPGHLWRTAPNGLRMT